MTHLSHFVANVLRCAAELLKAVMTHPLAALVVVAVEVVMIITAQFNTGGDKSDFVFVRLVHTHWRALRWVLKAQGWALVTTSRMIERALLSERFLRLVATAGLGYQWLHTCLTTRLGEAIAAQRGATLRLAIVTGTIQVHGPPIAMVRLRVLRAGEGSPSRSGVDVAQASDGSDSEAVHVWHGRVVTAFLGVLAGAIVALAIWLTNSYRLVGAAEHLGDVRLIVGVCLAAGALGGVVLHRSDDGVKADGFARGRDLRRWVSARALRASAHITRPGLDQPRRAPTTHIGTLLGRAGGRKVWATLKDVVLVIAPPQTGKTAYLGGRVIDAPGSVVATSTKADLYVYTAALRARRGPVWVFNPEGLGDVESTFRWSPLEGCENPEVAAERAGYLLSGAEKDHGEGAVFWREMNVKVLRCLLLAARLDDRDMRAVWRWINDSTDPTPLRILESNDGVPTEWVAEMRQVAHDTPERTRQSVYLTLAQAMQFMSSPVVTSAICPRPGEATFSIERFLLEGGTLYLLGSDRPYASLVPLFTAITGYIFEGAKRAAGRRPNGRLDPPLSLVLDEAALICPVPLPSMTADSGGRGIQLFVAVQSPSQLYERWGQRGGETIYNNSNAKLILGGLAHGRDLEDLSKVCGERDEHVHSVSQASGGGRGTTRSIRRVPVLAPHEIRQIQDGTALLLYRNMAPVIVRIERVWDRRDVKAAGRPAQPYQRPTLRAVDETTASPQARVPTATSATSDDGTMGNIVALTPRSDDADEADEELAAGGED